MKYSLCVCNNGYFDDGNLDCISIKFILIKNALIIAGLIEKNVITEIVLMAFIHGENNVMMGIKYLEMDAQYNRSWILMY